MTKLSTLFLGICILLFLGCSDDEEDFLTPLVGSWETYAMTLSGCTDPGDNGSFICEEGPGFLPCLAVTINSNSTYNLQFNLDDPPSTETGTATVTANTITFCETGSTDCDPLSYVLTGDALTITFTEDDGCLYTLVFTKI
jgi:hypothetical protein